jgi:4-amino-4-deoxy-L-arabinose transferase
MTPATLAWLVALLGWTVFFAFFHLDGGAGFETTDAWVAQSAREMRDTGEWIVPHFAGEPFLQKSPGPYWAVILAAWVRGTPVDEAATRVPNAVAAVLLVLTIFWLTRRIAGDRAAIFAGFAAVSSVFMLYWSHRGNAELALATLVAISLACFWIGADHPPGRARYALWMLGYLAAGVGMVYKLPMPLACVGVPAFTYMLLRNRWRLLLTPWHLLGLAFFLLPWLPWWIAVCIQEPTALAKWRVEFVDRFTGTMPNVQAHKVWYFYFLYLLPPLLYCIPYSLSLPGAIWRGFRTRAGVNRDGLGFVLIWFFSLLAFFTAATGRMPACCR